MFSLTIFKIFLFKVVVKNAKTLEEERTLTCARLCVCVQSVAHPALASVGGWGAHTHVLALMIRDLTHV